MFKFNETIIYYDIKHKAEPRCENQELNCDKTVSRCVALFLFWCWYCQQSIEDQWIWISIPLLIHLEVVTYASYKKSFMLRLLLIFCWFKNSLNPTVFSCVLKLRLSGVFVFLLCFSPLHIYWSIKCKLAVLLVGVLCKGWSV